VPWTFRLQRRHVRAVVLKAVVDLNKDKDRSTTPSRGIFGRGNNNKNNNNNNNNTTTTMAVTTNRKA
jgi:hypothetical protein